MEMVLHTQAHHSVFLGCPSWPPLAISSSSFHRACFQRTRPRLLVHSLLVNDKPPPLTLHFQNSSTTSHGSSLDTSLPSQMGLTDTSLESTWVHRIWVSTGCSSMAAMILKAIYASDSLETAASSVLAAAAAYVLADFGTGVYHWAVDNYGDASTPIFGSQIDAFQGHHKRPWTITKREFANNIHALARPASFALFPFLLLPSNSVVDTFLGVFVACVVFSQQFHAWAHSKKKDLPALVVRLQDKGLLVSRKMHGIHHKSPFNIRYCIVSGMCNSILDRTNFFGKLEGIIYARWGVKPRSWSETAPEWMQDGFYFADGTDTDPL